ncbi:maleylacetate reductase [Nesterenkonia lutea]|uniref:Alcohol dehydrogenase class IV n=1 Tax=Nesterenkonia lutea TaxID=272919 RepID=A0ABR9JHB4_9MICC|nr:maleylacetate reductase [Nesterenkonia lutea]MBE1525323.1 alcohol dehydrogenase class IV [Nesterenkonia lutea]
MTRSFSHRTLGQRVFFGAGNLTSDVGAERERLAARRVMLIASSSAVAAADQLGDVLPVAHRYDGARQHVPIEDAHAARQIAAEVEADLLVCVGGGSAIGLGKAIALRSRTPLIAVPTTFAGSEATNAWGMTRQGRKTTGVEDAVLPSSVVYDVDLVASLPADLVTSSGMNALAHCLDSLWAPGADPINEVLAVEAMRALSQGLVQFTANPGADPGADHGADADGLQQLQQGAYLAGAAFASAGSGLHHRICHVLGGTYNLPHAQTHAVVLPHVLAFNLEAAPAAGARIAAALGGADALHGLMQLGARVDAPRALKDLGMLERDLEAAAHRIHAVVPPSNPRSMDRRDAARLLRAAWSGDDPAQLRHPL